MKRKHFAPVGSRFGVLVVTGTEFKRGTLVLVPCVCDCGKQRDVAINPLVTKSHARCGCLYVDLSRKKFLTHGKSKTPTYIVWQMMIFRCTNKKNNRYKYYAGRGIVVCERWRESFENFIADMGERPEGRYSIDRIDNNGNYEPENCRWATTTEQARNQRTNRLITFRGETKTVAEWSVIVGISRRTIGNRIRLGWEAERILTETPHELGQRVLLRKKGMHKIPNTITA